MPPFSLGPAIEALWLCFSSGHLHFPRSLAGFLEAAHPAREYGLCARDGRACLTANALIQCLFCGWTKLCGLIGLYRSCVDLLLWQAHFRKLRNRRFLCYGTYHLRREFATDTLKHEFSAGMLANVVSKSVGVPLLACESPRSAAAPLN